MRQLTQKQEKFCNAIVSGMTAKDAYYAAYNTKCGAKTAYTEATRLLSKESIQKHIEELRKPLEHHAITVATSDREKKRSFLWNVINDSEQDMNNRLRAVDLLNKMDSEYINTNLNLDNSTNVLDNVDIDTLKQLTSN